jgi:glutamate-1-semialdehyde 2,1-aminomutase
MQEVNRKRLLPGGYGRSALVVGEEVPVAVRADGPWIWCEDGRRLLDFNNNFASLIHGHSHPVVVGAAVTALVGGASYGLSNEQEVSHAAALLERLPHADQVRYANSGTEAVMAAIRLARAATGRSRIVLLDGAYHGTADAVLPAMGDAARRGVTDGVAADTVPIPINDLNRLEEEIDRGDEPPAALLVDLLPNRIGMVPVSSEFIGRARNLCTERGVLLVLDEVISLRLGWSGLAGELQVRPDITVAGKLIGGGFPIGAIAGPESLMSELDPLTSRGLEHGGTFTANRVSMAAGRAAIELLTKDEIERINALGDQLRKKLAEGALDQGWAINGRGSLVRLVPAGTLSATAYRDLWWAAFNRGILLTPSGLMTVSTPMSEDTVSAAADAMLDAIGEVAVGCVKHSPVSSPSEVIG